MNNKRYPLVGLAFLFLFFTNANSQQIIKVGFDLSGGLSSVKYSSPSGIDGFTSSDGFVPGFGVSIHYFVDKNYGISSGLRLVSSKHSAHADNYYTSFESIDTDNQLYERKIWGNDISENLSLHLIDIPIHFFLKHSLNRNTALFFSLGPGLTIPVVKNFTGTGVFTYKGYYQDSKVTLYNIPVYGFNSDVQVTTIQKLKTSFVLISASVNTGISFAMNRYYSLVISAGYFRTISPLGKKNMPATLSNEIGSYNSILNNEKGSLSNVYLSLGITKDILF